MKISRLPEYQPPSDRQLAAGQRQMIPHATTTKILGRPGSMAYQDSGQTAWLEVRLDGALLLGPLEQGDWRVYPDGNP